MGQQLVTVVFREAHAAAQADPRRTGRRFRGQFRVHFHRDRSGREEGIQSLGHVPAQLLRGDTAHRVLGFEVGAQFVGQIDEIARGVEIAPVAAGNRVARLAVKGDRGLGHAVRARGVEHAGGDSPGFSRATEVFRDRVILVRLGFDGLQFGPRFTQRRRTVTNVRDRQAPCTELLDQPLFHRGRPGDRGKDTDGADGGEEALVERRIAPHLGREVGRDGLGMHGGRL